MLSRIAAFEWRTQTRQVAFVAAAALFLGFGAVLALTGFGPANLDVNSPYSIAESLALLSLFSVFAIATFCSAAIVRDREHRMEELVFTTAVRKRDLLFGRFAGSFAAAVTVTASSLAGLVAGALLRGNADGRRGAFHLLAYLWPFVTLVVPSMLAAAALIFAVAALTRSAIASHLAAVFLYLLYFAASALTNSPLMAGSSAAGQTTGSLGATLDPFGLTAFFELTRYWPPAVRNTRLLPLAGPLLVNRLLVLALAAGVLALVYWRFEFRVLSGAGRRARKVEPELTSTEPTPRTVIDDWLERVILYDLELESAEARRREDGQFDVSLRIRATRHEVKGDAELPLPLREEVAVELRSDAGVLQTLRPMLRSGENDVHLVTRVAPAIAIVDPDVTRVDVNRANNEKVLRP